MIDFSWKIFSQTGNIETYLLIKELESENESQLSASIEEQGEINELDTNV